MSPRGGTAYPAFCKPRLKPQTCPVDAKRQMTEPVTSESTESETQGRALAFAGTPAFAAHILEALVAAGQAPKLVLTQPDRGAGRGRKRMPNPVRRAAMAASLPVETPLRPADIFPALASSRVDVLLVAAYGLLVPLEALECPRLGCVNVHASLLPRWRGAAPVERAIIAGDRETGISIMRMDEGLDTGPVYERARLPIGPRATGEAVESELSELGAEVLLAVLADLEGRTPRPQAGQATRAPKLSAKDSMPDWRESAAQLDRRIRALAHRAPVWGNLEGTRVQVLSALPREHHGNAEPGAILPSDRHEILVACGSGALAIESVKVIRGKGRALGPNDARNGFPGLFRPGARFR